jgi:hypothetical protein
MRITNSAGRLSMMSTKRMSTLSSQPPTNPAMDPTKTPITTMMTTAARPIMSEVWVALASRANRFWPFSL